jgi:hypothetical protein
MKVWIDINDIHGSSMDSMAKAVEESYCVLICVTEKYRQSPNCQAEAQYAFKLRKPIIPLILEAGFEDSRGWLGILIGDKIFINFAKKKYDECLARLKSEVQTYLKQKATSLVETTSTDTNNTNGSFTKQLTSSSITDSLDKVKQKNLNKVQEQKVISVTNTMTSNVCVESWSEDEVREWFEANKIDKAIVDAITPCEGADLKQLHEMKRTAPEYYFQSLDRNKSIDLKHILKFNKLIEKLFSS